MTDVRNTEMLSDSTATSMKRGLVLAAALLLGISTLPAIAAAESTAVKLQQMSLPDAAGKVTPLFPKEQQAEVTIVCFLGSECPLAQLYGPRLQNLPASMKLGRFALLGLTATCRILAKM